MRNAYTVLVVKPEGKKLLGRSMTRWKVNIKFDKQGMKMWTGYNWLRFLWTRWWIPRFHTNSICHIHTTFSKHEEEGHLYCLSLHRGWEYCLMVTEPRTTSCTHTCCLVPDQEAACRSQVHPEELKWCPHWNQHWTVAWHSPEAFLS